MCVCVCTNNEKSKKKNYGKSLTEKSFDFPRWIEAKSRLNFVYAYPGIYSKLFICDLWKIFHKKDKIINADESDEEEVKKKKNFLSLKKKKVSDNHTNLIE